MEEKRIQHHLLRKLIKTNKTDFPHELTKLIITKIDKDLSLIFLSNSKNVTNDFMLNDKLFNSFKIVVNKLTHKLDDNTAYCFVPKYNVGSKIYLDFELLGKLRNSKGLSTQELSFHSNIDRSSLYNIEKNHPFDPSLSTILRYSSFFKKPLYALLSDTYKKEVLNIILNHFVVKEYLSEDKAKEIFKKES